MISKLKIPKLNDSKIKGILKIIPEKESKINVSEVTFNFLKRVSKK